jgi:hypothetical protein
MKNSYDALLKRIHKISKEDAKDKAAAAASLIPEILMLKKLILRKQAGKRPFSAAFDAPKKIRILEEAVTDIQRTILGSESAFSLKEALNGTIQIADDARAEITSDSMAADVLWIHGNLSWYLKSFC